MASKEMQLNDVGTRLELVVYDENNVVLDISQATVKQFFIQKPDGSDFTKTADFVTTGVDGKLQYVFISGDINQVGVWKVQAYIVLPTGSWKSSQISFRVKPNI